MAKKSESTEPSKMIPARVALNELIAIIIANPIMGARFTTPVLAEMIESALRGNGGLYLNFEREFACSASIDIEYDVDMDASRRDGKAQGRYKVHVGWSASTRSVVAANAALILYRQVVELATLLQARSDAMKPVVSNER